jgi:hypothetical protein
MAISGMVIEDRYLLSHGSQPPMAYRHNSAAQIVPTHR